MLFCCVHLEKVNANFQVVKMFKNLLFQFFAYVLASTLSMVAFILSFEYDRIEFFKQHPEADSAEWWFRDRL